MANSKSTLRYNERAWAIDVISIINQHCKQRQQKIVRAGGEYGVSGQGSVLFPDVLLFGEESGTVVLQGWELKMPDTALTDAEFIHNAQIKAQRLNLTSFLLCNVNEAVLYVQSSSTARSNGTSAEFQPLKHWCGTQAMSRATVQNSSAVWGSMIRQVLDDVNQLFNHGDITPSKPEWVIGDRLWVDFLGQHIASAAAHLKRVAQKKAVFSAELELWWKENKYEHHGYTKEQAFARVSIVSWINRLLFAHCLKQTHQAALSVETVVGDMSLETAVAVFERISQSSDFITILKPAAAQVYIDEATWSDLKDLNAFLTQVKLETISQDSLHAIIDSALDYSRKKLAGQFPTPRALAMLLAYISIDDLTQPVMDTCCGTGTIPRAIYDLKRRAGLSTAHALSSVWGSEKFAFPLQLSALAMADPLAMGEVVQVFPHDAFGLQIGQVVVFTNPSTGVREKRVLPAFHAIVSNLPFVRFEDSLTLNPSLHQFKLDEHACLSIHGLGKADLYAFLTLKLSHLLQTKGRLGLVLSNAWLGADWGDAFKALLLERFKILKIVVSGKGRWFANADVVTTLLILEKRTAASGWDESETIDFICTQKPIKSWEETPSAIFDMAKHMLVQSHESDQFTLNKHDFKQLGLLQNLGLAWSACFTALDWLPELAAVLTPANTLFSINRGARRGWAPLFYPQEGHGIEPDFIKPVLKSSKDIQGLIAIAHNDAFCCNVAIADLKKNKQLGALSWVNRFAQAVNEKGRPLPEVLKQNKALWYEMNPNELADFVVSVNPDKRLCVHRLGKRAFVNQRLIRFSSRQTRDSNSALHHALLNTAIGMFLIEALGFGRGLGALDLNASKLSAKLHMLNPALLSDEAAKKILKAFAPLLKREPRDLDIELKQTDRQHFDAVVLAAYSVKHLQAPIYASLVAVYNIRQTART